MKTTVQLDYKAIVANQAQPVHLAFQFTAPAHAGRRDQPIVFSVVLDRIGSMFGDPLQAALRATKTVVQNLRREDQFSLVTFEDTRPSIPTGRRIPSLRSAHRHNAGLYVSPSARSGGTERCRG